MKRAIWFSRHQPTDAQVTEIESLGFNLSADDIAGGVRLGNINLLDHDQVAEVVETIYDLDGAAIFGVFPTPVVEQMALHADLVQKGLPLSEGVPCYASWNVQRSVDGKPSFEHRRFCFVGRLCEYVTPAGDAAAT